MFNLKRLGYDRADHTLALLGAFQTLDVLVIGRSWTVSVLPRPCWKEHEQAGARFSSFPRTASNRTSVYAPNCVMDPVTTQGQIGDEPYAYGG